MKEGANLMIDTVLIQRKVEELNDYVIECRRTLHRHPELSGGELKTKAFIRREIDRLGLPVEDAAHTAQIVTLDTGRPGRHVLLRADIDALPIQENPCNLKGPRDLISENSGFMHACGHDGHTAMLLGAMKLLYSLKEDLEGIIYFVFEEGEENGGSVGDIMARLDKHHIDASWGIHLMPAIESGKINLEAGPRMAGFAMIDATVRGKGGHGSRPDLAANPVFAAASMFTNTAGAFVNQLDADKRVTFGLTSIMGGLTHNVIPDTALIKGTLRFFDVREGQKALDILKKVFTLTAEIYRCTVDFTHAHIAEAVTVNDPEKTALALEALGEVFPPETFVPLPPVYGSETMNRYLKKYPGVFMFLGTKNERTGAGADIHNEFFDLDEGVLAAGVLATVKYALAFLTPAS
jgi:amidohydrolase